MELINKTAIVTGAAGGIGQAIIAKLREQGAKVLAVDISEQSLQMYASFAPKQLETFVADVTDYQQVEAMVKYAVELFGSLDIMVNNAGIGAPKPLLDHDPIADFMRRAPARARIVISGIHTTPAIINYAYATVKELDLRFSYYYQPHEFEQCLQAIAEHKLPWQKMLTAKVGIDGVEDAFRQLMTPNDHIKVVIEPWRCGALEVI
ncbi:TPA: SDR family NAD(P)-dependent oxidoreductase [Vibrio alginolyticus]